MSRKDSAAENHPFDDHSLTHYFRVTLFKPIITRKGAFSLPLRILLSAFTRNLIENSKFFSSFLSFTNFLNFYNPKYFTTKMENTQYFKKPFTIAIVGGGIGGLTLAIGLLRKGISIQIYESALTFAEIGAGIAFGPNAIRSMALIDPAIKAAFLSRATKNEARDEEETWINFRCGLGDPTLIAKVQTRDQDKTGLSSVHRAHFIEDLVNLIPNHVANFGKRLMSLEQEPSGKVLLLFEDGTTAYADAVVGCDGVRSRVRQILLGKENLLDDLSFSGKYAYRGLVSMAKAKEALGDYLAGNSQMYLGPEGHILTYPIEHGKVMNVVAFKNQNAPWKHENWTLKSKGLEFQRDFKGWGKPVQNIVNVRAVLVLFCGFDYGLFY